MRERIRPRQRGAMSRRSALNSAIKTPAHVYYFILVPGPPRLKRIHNYRCLREPLNLSRAPARTSLIYACVDFTPTPRSPESAPHVGLFVPTNPECLAYTCPRGPGKSYPRRVIQINRVGFRAPTGKRNRAAAHKSCGERAFHRTDLRSIVRRCIFALYSCGMTCCKISRFANNAAR